MIPSFGAIEGTEAHHLREHLILVEDEALSAWWLGGNQCYSTGGLAAEGLKVKQS